LHRIVVKLDAVLPGIHAYNAFVRIEEVTKTTVPRFDGTKLQIAEGLAGDETGVIKFRVVGDEANVLEKGKVVAWRNGLSEVFQSRHRLGLDRFGRITVEDVTDLYHYSLGQHRPNYQPCWQEVL
jgi:replication factor A1